MIIAIIACEIGFWIAIALGLITRYPLNKPRLGKAFLYSTPLIDLLLLSLVVINLRSGAEPHLTHGIAALYIGFSVAFGHQLIAWTDREYRRRFRNESVAEPDQGTVMQDEVHTFVRALLAAAVAAVIIEITVLVAENPAAGETLRQWHKTLLVILGIWLITGPVWEFFSPDKNRHTMDNNEIHGDTPTPTA